MKAAEVTKYGGTDAISINNNAENPKVVSGKVIAEIYSTGLNPFDVKWRSGFYGEKILLKFPSVLGGDFSGVITEVGDGVYGYKVGDEVYGSAGTLSGGSGSLAQCALADIKNISLKPKTINFEEASALPLTGVSALMALTEHIKLKKSQKILIHGGGGGIGTMAIQLAKYLGAFVITTAGTDDLEYVKNLGADEVINYKTQNFEELVKGADAVYDTVGGETYKKSYQVLKRGGKLVSMLEQPDTELINKFGITVIAQQTRTTQLRLKNLAELVDKQAVKVHIDKVFSLEQAGEALTYLQEGHPKGKVIVKIK